MKKDNGAPRISPLTARLERLERRRRIRSFVRANGPSVLRDPRVVAFIAATVLTMALQGADETAQSVRDAVATLDLEGIRATAAVDANGLPVDGSLETLPGFEDAVRRREDGQ